MKITIKKMVITSVAIILTSCATTQKTSENNNSDKINTEELQAQEAPEPAPEPAPVVVPAPTAAEIYAEKISGISLSVVSSPKETTKNKPFSAPYIIKAINSDGTPAKNLEVSILCPASRTNDEVSYTETKETTGEDGTITFTAPVPKSSFNTAIRFYPSCDVTDPETKKIAVKNTVQAEYKVQTNLKLSGGIIGLVDFTPSGKPITSNPMSSSNLLMTLMQKGFKSIGNIDLSSDVLRGNRNQIYNNAKAMVGNNYAFLLYGTVKYEQYEKTENGFICTLIAEITCLNLKDSSILYSTKVKGTAKESSEWTATQNARKKLSENLSEALIYGL